MASMMSREVLALLREFHSSLNYLFVSKMDHVLSGIIIVDGWSFFKFQIQNFSTFVLSLFQTFH